MAKTRTKKSNGSEALPTNAAMSEINAENGSGTQMAAAETGSMEMKSIAKKLTRKPEVVRTESRSNVVPINLEDQIRHLAYLMSERRGFAPGHETEDWLAAEHEVRERYHHQTVQTA
jgi:hypothetical protein